MPSSASVSAARSPFRPASRKSSRILPPLMREGRRVATAGCYHALRADSSADDQLAVLARLWLAHRFDADARTNHGGEAVDVVVAVALEVRGKVRVDAHDDVLAWCRGCLRADGAEELGGEGLVGFRHAAAFARGTGRAEQRAQVLPHALARHLHEAELRDLEHVGARLIGQERTLEGAVDLVAVLGGLHVDEVDDDDAAEVPQPDLSDDLADRLHVDLEHGLLEVTLADVLAGVDVDGDERLRVVDDDVAAGLEPDSAAQRFFDLLLDAEGLEDGRRLLPQTYTFGERGHERFDVLPALLVHVARVGDKLVDVGREEVEHDTERQVALLVGDCSSGRRCVTAVTSPPTR